MRKTEPVEEKEHLHMRMKLLAMVIGLGMIGLWRTGGLAADSSQGKAVYEKSCVGCHGADGKGNPAMAKVLGEKGLNIATTDVAKKSDAQLLKVITEGAGKMPAQKNISKDDQKRVVDYVRSLAK